MTPAELRAQPAAPYLCVHDRRIPEDDCEDCRMHRPPTVAPSAEPPAQSAPDAKQKTTLTDDEAYGIAAKIMARWPVATLGMYVALVRAGYVAAKGEK